MRVTIDVDRQEARTFTRVLNEDDGFRETAVHALLQHNKAAGIDRMTAFVNVLGRISKGFTEALEHAKLLDRSRRRKDIRVLAGVA